MEEKRRQDDDYCTRFSRRSANALGQVVSGSLALSRLSYFVAERSHLTLSLKVDMSLHRFTRLGQKESESARTSGTGRFAATEEIPTALPKT